MSKIFSLDSSEVKKLIYQTCVIYKYFKYIIYYYNDTTWLHSNCKKHTRVTIQYTNNYTNFLVTDPNIK